MISLSSGSGVGAKGNEGMRTSILRSLELQFAHMLADRGSGETCLVNFLVMTKLPFNS